MSDLISREALLVFIDNNFRSYWDYQTVQEFFNIITNAPAVSGEAVAKYKINANGFESPRWLTHQEKFNGVTGKDYRLLYTTPQQAQSVADALEEVAKIVNENIKSLEIRKSKVLDDAEIYNYYENDICTLKPIVEAIRALIKRNAPKEGE